jgi:hypothetical protein
MVNLITMKDPIINPVQVVSASGAHSKVIGTFTNEVAILPVEIIPQRSSVGFPCSIMIFWQLVLCPFYMFSAGWTIGDLTELQLTILAHTPRNILHKLAFPYITLRLLYVVTTTTTAMAAQPTPPSFKDVPPTIPNFGAVQSTLPNFGAVQAAPPNVRAIQSAPPNFGASQSTLSNFEVQSDFGSGVLQLLRLFETRMQGMLEVQTTQIQLDMISMAHKAAH